MSERIEVGDLAQVVRGCGCFGGFIERVNAVGAGEVLMMCDKCRWQGMAVPAVWAGWHMEKMYAAPLSWLKKIPPLSTPDHVTETEEISA